MLVIPIDDHLMHSGPPHPVVSTSNHKLDVGASETPTSPPIHKMDNPGPSVFAQSPSASFAPVYYPAVSLPKASITTPAKNHPVKSYPSQPSASTHNFPVDVKAVKRRVCGNCQRQFVRYDHFQRHVKKCGKLKKLSVEEIQQSMTCANCNRKYQRRDHYERHIKKCITMRSGGAGLTLNSNTSPGKHHHMKPIHNHHQDPNRFSFNLSTLLPTVKLSNPPSGRGPPSSHTHHGSMVIPFSSKHHPGSVPATFLPLYSTKNSPLYEQNPETVYYKPYKQTSSPMEPKVQQAIESPKSTEVQPKVEIVEAKSAEKEQESSTAPSSSKENDESTRRCWKRAIPTSKVTVVSNQDDVIAKELSDKRKPEDQREGDKKYVKKKSVHRGRSCADIAEKLIDIHKSQLMKKAVHSRETSPVNHAFLNGAVNETVKRETSPCPMEPDFLPEILSTPNLDLQAAVSVAHASTIQILEEADTYADDDCPTICLVTPEEEENLTPEKEKAFTNNISAALIAYLKKLYNSEDSNSFHQMMNEIFYDQLRDQEFIYWLYKKFQS